MTRRGFLFQMHFNLGIGLCTLTRPIVPLTITNKNDQANYWNIISNQNLMLFELIVESGDLCWTLVHLLLALQLSVTVGDSSCFMEVNMHGESKYREGEEEGIPRMMLTVRS